jgi:hypothetical protein
LLIKDDLMSGNKSVDVYTYLNSGFLGWRGGLLRLKGISGVVD